MILLKESDRPKSIGEKLAEYLSRPPQPILRFYGDFKIEDSIDKRHILLAVRNGLPLPLLYGIYIRAKYDSSVDYIEKTDHIGPFSIDDWRLTLDTLEPAVVEIRVGLIPFEFLLDRTQITV
ncbi:unnamed protein product [marine sediment metagenome]|uniref:Uncharacterized protein n=1 Tax=marine sediment metagenome TaxID=412755 RepID=X1SAS0_9ZZZZ